MNKSDKIFCMIVYIASFLSGSILIYRHSNAETMWGVLLIAVAVRMAVYMKENIS